MPNSDLNMQELLSAMTDALMAEASKEEIDLITQSYEVQREEVDSVFHVVSQLHNTLVSVKPSSQFTQRLKQELVGDYDPSLVGHLRRLPARVQIVALLVFLGGFLFISRRRQEVSNIKEVTI